jgi:hypothetical protein
MSNLLMTIVFSLLNAAFAIVNKMVGWWCPCRVETRCYIKVYLSLVDSTVLFVSYAHENTSRMDNCTTVRSPSTPARPAASSSLRSNSVRLTFVRGWALSWPFRRSTGLFCASRYLLTFCSNMHAHDKRNAVAVPTDCRSMHASVLCDRLFICCLCHSLPASGSYTNERSSLLIYAAWSTRYVASNRAIQC